MVKPEACSMCRFLFHDIKRLSKGNDRYSITMWTKLIKYALTGIEIVYGSKPEFEQTYEKVICVGDCHKKNCRKKMDISLFLVVRRQGRICSGIYRKI